MAIKSQKEMNDGFERAQQEFTQRLFRLSAQVKALEAKVTAMEGPKADAPAPAAPEAPAAPKQMTITAVAKMNAADMTVLAGTLGMATIPSTRAELLAQIKAGVEAGTITLPMVE